MDAIKHMRGCGGAEAFSRAHTHRYTPAPLYDLSNWYTGASVDRSH